MGYKILITKVRTKRGSTDNFNVGCDYELFIDVLPQRKSKLWCWREDYKGYVGYFTDTIRKIYPNGFETIGGTFKYSFL